MNYKWLKENTFFIVLLLIAILIRFIPIHLYQFSHDELSALSRTVYGNFRQEILFGVQYTDTHPFLIQAFLFYWVKCFGDSEIAVKLPFLICGVLSGWAIYRFTRQWFGLQAALYSQLIVSASFIFILYSSYARMYAPGLLFSILLLHYLFNIVFKEKPAPKDFMFFALFCLLSAFNNHLNALFAFTCAFAGLFTIHKKYILKYLLTCLAIILCYLPHLPVTLTQFQTGGLGTHENGWLPPPKSTVLLDFMKALFGTGYAGIGLLCISVLVIATTILMRKKVSKKQMLLLVLFLVNYGTIHLYSIFKSPVLQYSVLLFSAPCLLVFVSSFYESLDRKVFNGLCALVLAALLAQGIFVKHELGDVNRQDFEMMSTEAINTMDRSGDHSVSAIFTAEPYFIWHYESACHRRIPHALASDTVFLSPKSTRAYFSALPPSVHEMVLGDVSPVMAELAKERFPLVTAHRQGVFYNVLSLADASYKRPGINNDWLMREYDLFIQQDGFKRESVSVPSGGAYLFDGSSGEFPFSVKMPFEKLDAKEGQWLLLALDFETGDPALSKEDLLCVSVNTADSTKNYFTAARFADFYTGQKINKLYLQVFVGSDSDEWNKTGELACFIWKKDKAALRLDRFILQKIDYNPAKWTLWE